MSFVNNHEHSFSLSTPHDSVNSEDDTSILTTDCSHSSWEESTSLSSPGSLDLNEESGDPGSPITVPGPDKKLQLSTPCLLDTALACEGLNAHKDTWESTSSHPE